MTTNLDEAYNWVLRSVQGLPLVGIVEFFLYRTMKYFKERYQLADNSMRDNHRIYGYKMTE